MCWVGLAEHDEHRRVRPIACAGHEEGYLSVVDIVWSDTPHGRGPTGVALRTRRPAIGSDFEVDPALAPWRAEARQRGYRTSLALPLVHEGKAFGSITTYSGVPETFDDNEMRILDQLSNDVSYGAHALRQRAERERLATAIEQAAEAVVTTDLQGTITYVNPAFEAVTGYSRSEAVGQNPRLLKSGAHDPSFYKTLWETLLKGATWRGRIVNRKKDGSLYTDEATLSPVRDPNGEIVSYVGVKRDISRDLAMEAQLLQAQKMEGIGRLAGGVAHDFNNILTVILSFSGFILDALPEGHALRADALEIEKAGKRAAALTRQLLAFSRKQVLQVRPVHLNTVLADLDKMLRRILGEDIAMAQDLAPDLGLITADPGQIEQVFVNLLVNSRDAMPDGGTVTLRTSNVDFTADEAAQRPGMAPGAFVRVTISDTGIGMDEGTVAHIFEPFFTTKERGRGTGLGLSTVYGIVQQTGGLIEVASKLGAGTTFHLYFPRGAAHAPIEQSPEVVTQLRGREAVLVVEDDEAVRHVARRILESAGYTVLTAASGREAVALCESLSTKIDLVLSDVVMPGMSGRVLAQRLTALRPNLKILYMSGYPDDAIARHGILDPGTHFANKPVTRVDLLQKVREVLGAA